MKEWDNGRTSSRTVSNEERIITIIMTVTSITIWIGSIVCYTSGNVGNGSHSRKLFPGSPGIGNDSRKNLPGSRDWTPPYPPPFNGWCCGIDDFHLTPTRCALVTVFSYWLFFASCRWPCTTASAIDWELFAFSTVVVTFHKPDNNNTFQQ